MNLLRALLATVSLLVIGVNATAQAAPTSTAPAPVKVQLETDLGRVVIELDTQKAPKTCANFLHYVDSHFYDGTIFHRVIANFPLIQAKVLQAPNPWFSYLQYASQVPEKWHS